MNYDYDVAVIGTGTSAYFVVNNCLAEGLSVAVIDSREYGGTCAMRGCQPKKFLIAAAEAVERTKSMRKIGISTVSGIDWHDLMRSKNGFTDPVPRRTEKGFQKAGADTLHGHARFAGPNTLAVEGRTIAARYIVIATGAVPRRLDFPGSEYLSTSDAFLNLRELPPRIIFVGGGYISFEFAHVANQAGAEVTILHRSEQVLKNFDSDLVDKLVEASREAGISIHTNVCVDAIEKHGASLSAHCSEKPGERFESDLIVHGAGRAPAVEDLNLEAGSVDFTARGITVNEYLQSTSNPAVYAVGDVAASPFRLATTADMEGEIASKNIVSGNHAKADYSVVAGVVFTLPPLAAVGLKESQAREKNMNVIVNKGDMTGWPSSLRIGQTHAAYKVIQHADDKRILGAHILGHNADEAVNIFALAIKFALPSEKLKQMLWAYPTYVSDLKYMFK